MAAFRAARLFGLLFGSVLALCVCFPGANGRRRAAPLELAAARHNYYQLHQHQQHLQHQPGTWRPVNLGRQLLPPTHKHEHKQPKIWRHHQSGSNRNHHVDNNFDQHELLHSPGCTTSRLVGTNGEQLLGGGGGRSHHRASASASLTAAAEAADLRNKANFVHLRLPATAARGEQVETTILQSNLGEELTLTPKLAAEQEAIEVSEAAASANSRRQAGKYKRQALDLTVNRLHILEGFDEQLREFAEAAAAANSATSSTQLPPPQKIGQPQSPSNGSSRSGNVGGDDNDDDNVADGDRNSDLWRQELCVLTLDFPADRGRSGNEMGGEGGGSAFGAKTTSSSIGHYSHRHKQQQHNCLASERLTRHVPPYMLNLHSQLLSESRTLADAVRLLPYQSLVVRSFRQPPLAALGLNSSAAFAAASFQATTGATVESAFAGSASDSQPVDASASDGGFRALSKSTPSEVTGAEASYYGDNGRSEDERPPVVEHNGREPPEPSIVVELSALGPAPSSEETQLEEHEVALGAGDSSGDAGYDQDISGNVADRNSEEPAEELQPLALDSQGSRSRQRRAKGRIRLNGHQQQQLDASNEVERPELAACNLAQRAEPAHERSQLCYWFQLGEQLRLKINGSLVRSGHSSAWKRERLLEAELHVFKLLPEMFDESALVAAASGGSVSGAGGGYNNGGQVATHWMAQPQQTTVEAALTTTTTTQSEKERAGHWPQQQTRRSNHSRSSWQHLKTNLLEVSLYQILPKKNSSYLYERTSATATAEVAAAEFPLRLLDIRRIDLHSTGWETFYVKRAVEDWLRDTSLNLGLVIKAKSMFGEPVRIGLIRFSDLYDHPKRRQQHHHQNQLNTHARSTSERPTHHLRHHEQQQQQQQRFAGHEPKQPPASQPPENQFDLDHQPILVIYTTAVH